MFFSFLLHFYQPYYQQEDILERIVEESYRPLINIFLNNPGARATFNVSGGLVELLKEKGYGDFITSLGEVVRRGQVELTGSAAFHAFLPLLPEKEKKRQVEINERIIEREFGLTKKPKGFFSPELAFDYHTAELIDKMGYQWMVVPEIAYGSEPPRPDHIFELEDSSGLSIFFRHKRASVLILSGVTRTLESFKKEVADLLGEKIYLLPIMDAETFGHHRPGLEDFLEELLTAKEFETLTVSELTSHFNEPEVVSPRESTWSNEEQDFWLDKEQSKASRNPFLLWKDPHNPIHKLQWDFTYWVIDVVESSCGEQDKSRRLLDKVLASDQFWWASAKPWWSLEMIEAGAYRLKKVVEMIPAIGKEKKEKAEDYYRQILDQAFSWQRSGKIRRAHKEAEEWKETPFRERAPAEWYNQIILEFEDQMKKAAEKREYEKAIKWRDAITKLRKGTDVHDVVHVVNDLHTVRKIPSLKPVLEHEEEEISDFARKNFREMKG